MESLTPWEICVIVLGLIMAAAAAINTLGSAGEKIIKAWKAAKAPNDQQDARLERLEGRMDKVEAMLCNDNARFEEMNSSNRITQRALLALLDHGIDGNNIKQMQDAKDELQTHLINR